MKIVEVYTDGTIMKGIPGWCFAVIANDTVVYQAGGVLRNPELAALRNIASELKAVMEAVRFAKKHNYKVIIWTDLQGNIEWIADLLSPNKKPWRTNNKWTQMYREFMFAHKEYIEDIRWLKGHAGNKWNEYVDVLSRKVWENEMQKLRS